MVNDVFGIKSKMSEGSDNRELIIENLGLILGLFQLSIWGLVRYYKKSKVLEESYWSERRGRTRVEQEIRHLTSTQLNTSQGFFIQSIGTIESCYKQCIGLSNSFFLSISLYFFL